MLNALSSMGVLTRVAQGGMECNVILAFLKRSGCVQVVCKNWSKYIAVRHHVIGLQHKEMCALYYVDSNGVDEIRLWCKDIDTYEKIKKQI